MRLKIRSLKKNDRGSLGYFLAFILLGTMLVFLFAIAIPFMTAFSSAAYTMGDSIMGDSEDMLNSIRNETVRTELTGTINDAQGATADNISIMSLFYKYGWILIIVITIFTIFMLARKMVETNQAGSFGIA